MNTLEHDVIIRDEESKAQTDVEKGRLAQDAGQSLYLESALLRRIADLLSVFPERCMMFNHVR